MAMCVLRAVLISVWLPVVAVAQPRLNVFLDCEGCFQDFIRSEITFVEYVRDPREADIHVIVTSSPTGSGGRERAVSFLGVGRLAGIEHQLKAATEAGEPEDAQRRTLANTITIGLLNYHAAAGVGGDLSVTVRQRNAGVNQAPLSDPWNNWVMSVRGSVSVQGEESNRETQLNGEVGADRITNDWKITTEGSSSTRAKTSISMRTTRFAPSAMSARSSPSS